jgi:hypothetical protein
VGVDDVADGWEASARAPVEAADDDLTVIRRSKSDPERFAVLVRRHGPAVGRYVTRRIGQERAEDVVAETFLVGSGSGPTTRTKAGTACRGCTES